MQIFPKNARVVFAGDSITAQCNYTTRIADYYNKNLPEQNVKFAVGAVSGSSLSHAIKFFDKLVLRYNPTHVTVFFGVNDCGRGWLNAENKEERDEKLTAAYERYKTNLETYLDMLVSHNITPILITPAPYAEFMKIDSEVFANGHRLVCEYAEVMRSAARRRGIELVDFHARLSELYMYEDIYGADRVILPTSVITAWLNNSCVRRDWSSANIVPLTTTSPMSSSPNGVPPYTVSAASTVCMCA